jgi:hypothetical protein
MGMEVAPETSENLQILTRLAAGEDFIEFCRRESFEDLYNVNTYQRFGGNLSVPSSRMKKYGIDRLSQNVGK